MDDIYSIDSLLNCLNQPEVKLTKEYVSILLLLAHDIGQRDGVEKSKRIIKEEMSKQQKTTDEDGLLLSKGI